jgi:uncharacterized protein
VAEKTIKFSINDNNLFGILNLPDDAEAIESIVLMIIGGAQTRIGSHRMYVQLARHFCDNGVPVMRFDYQGLGDSEGEFVGFEYAGPSIRAAIDMLYAEFSELKSLIIWSLCDGAAASMIYAADDVDRISAMVLANPFLETEAGKAQTVLKYYYIKRLFDRELWKKIFGLKFKLSDSASSFLSLVKTSTSEEKGGWLGTGKTMPQCVLDGLHSFPNPVHFLISSNDIQGLEFYNLIRNDKICKNRIARGDIVVKSIKGGDHTFTDLELKKIAFDESLLAIKENALLPVV